MWRWLLLAVVAFGCKREPVVSSETGSGRAAIAPRPKLLDAVCPPRVLGPDPGPTKGQTGDVKDECVKHADCTERSHGRVRRVHER